MGPDCQVFYILPWIFWWAVLALVGFPGCRIPAVFPGICQLLQSSQYGRPIHGYASSNQSSFYLLGFRVIVKWSGEIKASHPSFLNLLDINGSAKKISAVNTSASLSFSHLSVFHTMHIINLAVLLKKVFSQFNKWSELHTMCSHMH